MNTLFIYEYLMVNFYICNSIRAHDAERKQKGSAPH